MKKCLIPILLILITQNSFSQSHKDIDGYWLQEGYGVYLEVSDSLYKMYDVTKISCQPASSLALNNWSGSLSTLLDLYNIEDLSAESMILKYGITSYKFNRLKEPLKRCKNPISSSDDPKLNFEVFWHTFKENYAYSSLRGVNWDTIYAEYGPRISENTTEQELYGYFREILDSINDGHISLRVPEKIRNAHQKKETVKSLAKNNPTEEYDYPTARGKAQQNVLKLYAETTFKTYHKDLMIWGKLDKNIGYIQINGMNGYSPDVHIPDSLDSGEYWQKHWEKVFKGIEEGKTLGQYLRGEIKGANTAMDSVMKELSNTAAIIIDLRFNPGGTDQVALDILSRFTDSETKIFTKKIRTGNNRTFDSEVFVKSSKNSYKGRLALLTSPQSASSAETMILGSLKLPNMIRIGSNTMGIFSDVLQKKLPNGWRFGLSNEIYETEIGENYEHKGIPPDFMIAYSRDWSPFYKSIIALKNIDPAIEKSISLLNN